MLTVKVQFPDGEREVPAELRSGLAHFSFGSSDLGPVPRTPEPIGMNGWRFEETVGGWVALKTFIERED